MHLNYKRNHAIDALLYQIEDLELRPEDEVVPEGPSSEATRTPERAHPSEAEALV